MPDIPQEAITAAVAAIERELLSGKDYSMALDSDEALARAALEAAAPILADAVAEKIKAHGDRCPRVPALSAWHRHFGIAVRIAAGAFTTDQEKRQQAAAAIGWGEYAVCDIADPPAEGEQDA